MADTTVTSGFVPELLTDAVAGGFAGMKALAGTGAALIKNGMPGTIVGQKINVPYFGILGEFDDVSTDGTELTPVELTSAAEQATISQSGKAVSMTDWAQWAQAGSDPYAEAGAQITAGASRRIDKALIDVALAAPAGMTLDVYNASTPKYLDWSLICDGIAKFGDEDSDIAAVVTHSANKAVLRKAVDSTGRPLYQEIAGQLPSINGIPVIASDRLTATASKMPTLIVKKNALVAWVNSNPSIETVRNVLAAKTIMAVHIFFAAHRYTRMPGLSKGGVVLLKHN